MSETASHIAIIDQLEDATERFLSEFEKSFPGAQEQIFEDVKDIISQLKRRNDGSLVSSVENLKLIDKFRNSINTSVKNSEYGTAAYDFVNSFKKNTSFINDYFSSIVVEFKDNDRLLKQVLDVNIQTTVDGMLGSGMNANFTQPIIKSLKDHIKSGSDRIEVVKSIEEMIIGSKKIEGRLKRYASQVAGDSITQFNNNYIDVISSDLGLNHYFYKGTKIKDTREFCRKMAGKYFTEAEMKRIVEEESNKNNGAGWSGMIPGTNWTNFGTNRGGYRCRHYRIPVSKEIYERFKG